MSLFGDSPLHGWFDHIGKQYNPIEVVQIKAWEKKLEMNNLKELHYCLGVKFERNR